MNNEPGYYIKILVINSVGELEEISTYMKGKPDHTIYIIEDVDRFFDNKNNEDWLKFLDGQL